MTGRSRKSGGSFDGRRHDLSYEKGMHSQDRRKPAGQAASSARPGAAQEEMSVRINKYIASTGFCSRRRADELIAEGRVTIDGRSATAGDRVDRETVCIDGQPVRTEERLVTLMLNKPVQVVSTARDPQGRTTVLEYVPERYRSLRLYPVGRLDYFSEGLLLLTNDGALAQRLTHPSHNQKKVYHVLVRGSVSPDVLATLRGGMTLKEGDKVAPCPVDAVPLKGQTELTFELHQGLNRQIRRMCRDTGLTVLRLKRVAEGSLHLGRLAPGEVRELSPKEVAALKK